MKIKKWIAFMAALCITLGATVFAACGGGNDDDNGSSEEISSSSEEISSEEEYPLGTVNNPHHCYYYVDEETEEESDSMYVPTIKANSADYYIISRSADRFICVKQANVTIVYGANSYSAKDGDIEFQSLGDAGDMHYWATIQIINDTDADIELVMTFKDVAVE